MQFKCRKSVTQFISQALFLCGNYRIVRLNKNYFNNHFHLETGTSPWDYFLQLRIEKVKNLLSDPDLPIADVAQQSGFCDQSYMSRVFKKFENITPRQFRSAFYKINSIYEI